MSGDGKLKAVPPPTGGGTGSVLRVRRAGFILGVLTGGVRLVDDILLRDFFPAEVVAVEVEEDTDDLLLDLVDLLRAGEAESSSSVATVVAGSGRSDTVAGGGPAEVVGVSTGVSRTTVSPPLAGPSTGP